MVQRWPLPYMTAEQKAVAAAYSYSCIERVGEEDTCGAEIVVYNVDEDNGRCEEHLPFFPSDYPMPLERMNYLLERYWQSGAYGREWF